MKKKKKPILMPETLNDCILLYQMGYTVQVHDGKVVAVVKENKKKNGLISRTNSQPYCITDAIGCQGG